MYEPFPGNYVWNLQTNLALVCGGNHGEIDVANRPIMDAAKAGEDAGTAKLFDSWIAVADQVAANAAADEKDGYLLSAGTKYLRASGYYLSAERMQSRDYAPRWAAYDKGLALYRKGVGLRGLHVDFVEIPYEGASFPGIFVHDGSGTPRPALVSCNGLDSMKEQIDMAGHGASNLERGINTLFVDQPGTGEALRKRGLTAVYDAERWGTPALDYLLTRPDVISTKVGMFGVSLGGYYAPRIAANEPRYALCAVMGANHVWGERQKERLQREGENPVPHYWDHVLWVWGQARHGRVHGLHAQRHAGRRDREDADAVPGDARRGRSPDPGRERPPLLRPGDKFDQAPPAHLHEGRFRNRALRRR